jgi:hypothetical protein
MVLLLLTRIFDGPSSVKRSCNPVYPSCAGRLTYALWIVISTFSCASKLSLYPRARVAPGDFSPRAS